MKSILMNKNTEVLVAEYVEEAIVFSKIYHIKNIDYAPVILNKLLTSNIYDARALSDLV